MKRMFVRIGSQLNLFAFVAASLTVFAGPARAQAPAPEPAVVLGVTANSVGLAWNDIYDNEDGFRVSRWDGQEYVTIAVLGANVTNYLDTGLQTGTTYYYQVVAFNTFGDSEAAFNSAMPTPIAGPEPLVVTATTAN